jgi:thiol-disulfide isomerase/thioredoxin
MFNVFYFYLQHLTVSCICKTQAYAPWCVDCEAISKNIEKLAKHFSGLDNLKFARIDASVNEHPKLKVNSVFAVPPYAHSRDIKYV